MEPDAPTRLRGTKLALPRYFDAYCASSRPERSESPPAPNGITRVIGFTGYCWASALPKKPSETSNTSQDFICILPRWASLAWPLRDETRPGLGGGRLVRSRSPADDGLDPPFQRRRAGRAGCGGARL